MSLTLAYQLIRNFCRIGYEYMEENRTPEEKAERQRLEAEAEAEARKPKPLTFFRFLGYLILSCMLFLLMATVFLRLEGPLSGLLGRWVCPW